MNNNVDDFSVAIDILNNKIAEFNIKISLNKTEELNKEIDKCINLKKKIYEGDTSLIKKIIDGEII